MLKDSQQRAQAIDPRRSFIVQAPAGSGKTEILTQRYLRLLATVNAPEQIVALTFTRKAANEMRERIVLALQQVDRGVQATSAHQEQTFRFAAEALQRSQLQNWKLLEQPSRLRVVTIDSLCQTLCQAIPLQDKQVPFAQISDEPELHYRRTARACLAHALEDKKLQQPLAHLLLHLDNRQERLLDLFCELLATRSQWLTSLYSAREQDQKYYEHMLALIEQHELARFQQSIPDDCLSELSFLAQQMALIEANPQSLRHHLIHWHNHEQIDRQIAAGLAALLLTSDDKLRKRFDHHIGLKRGVCDEALYNQLKSGSQTLLGQLAESVDFLDALIKVKNLPAPYYDAEQWQVLQALFILLPLLVGHLHLVFAEHNEVDFNEVAQQALNALGTEEQPTDLALYLDNTIHHLLIDEFQDTSIQQFQLLTQLVQEWQPGDGKTLFVVGDPMQSIYRFRQAEVGLFLKAKQAGIGPVHLDSLELCCNFRSTATLVNWVNQQFKTIFPAQDDMESGAISFHSSVSVHATSDDSQVNAWQFPNRREEALALVKFAADELKNYPQDQIAILVRSRSQLADIVKALREQQIPFQGVEIEHLAKLPHLRDLWSLTQALLLPANRLAWLSLLRSPLGGLSLSDLLRIANFDKRKSIYYALSQLHHIADLSEEGQMRAHFVFSVLHEALACRHQHPFVAWVDQTHQNLQAHQILDTNQQDDLEQFWLLLERCTRFGQLPDLDHLQTEFAKLYSQRVTPSRLQVMTIHKSKGLEFDCVILPALSAKSKNKNQPLLRWLKLPRQKQNDLLLVSPIKAAHQEHCLLYDYLAKLDSEKDYYELQRLFYVATTRAKKRLCLFDNNEKETQGTLRSFLKNQPFLAPDETVTENNVLHSLPQLYKLPNEFYQRLPLTADYKESTLVFLPTDTPKRQVGIVAHELLQWICDYHPHTLEELPWGLVTTRFKSLGFTVKEQTEASATLRQQISCLLNSAIGQWLCKAHQEERNEYELLINAQGVASTRIIDRTFIENGVRWIIDFKTGKDDETAQSQHRQQVNDYAQLLASQASLPIRCGLYYLASSRWIHWEYSLEHKRLENSTRLEVLKSLHD